MKIVLAGFGTVGKNVASRLLNRELIDKTDPLYAERDNNSIRFSTEYNNYILIGKGAGGKQMANPIVRDLLDIYQVDTLQDQTVSRFPVLSAR